MPLAFLCHTFAGELWHRALVFTACLHHCNESEFSPKPRDRRFPVCSLGPSELRDWEDNIKQAGCTKHIPKLHAVDFSVLV